MSVQAADSWDEVWAEYDARESATRPAPMRRTATASTSRQVRANRRGGLMGTLLGMALALATAAAGYVAAPWLTAQRLADAWQRGDTTALGVQVDWSALRDQFQAELAEAARSLPPGRTAGLTSGGAAFLDGLAAQVATGLATAEGMDELVRRRLGMDHPWSPQAAAPTVTMEPLTLTTARATIPAAEGGEGPVVLTLALIDPSRLRWQVRSITLPD